VNVNFDCCFLNDYNIIFAGAGLWDMGHFVFIGHIYGFPFYNPEDLYRI
jgi:hypothetical protein